VIAYKSSHLTEETDFLKKKKKFLKKVLDKNLKM